MASLHCGLFGKLQELELLLVLKGSSTKTINSFRSATVKLFAGNELAAPPRRHAFEAKKNANAKQGKIVPDVHGTVYA